MQLRALRRWGALLLVTLVACPAMTADAAAPSTRDRAPTRVQAARTGTGTAVAKRARPRRARRAPARRARRRGPVGVVYARNAIVVDPVTQQVLFEKQSGQTVPIASLTKLMTALVFLEQKPDLRRVAEVTRAEISGGGHTQLRNHEQVSLYDLLHMGLMNSDNVATRVLARETGLTAGAFVARMNARAAELGLANTRYVEFTGLDERNVSTAADVAKLLRVAADHYLIREITTTPTYVFTSERPRRTHQIVNSNRLVRGNRYEVNCGKTGFISEAGYCVATWVRDRGRDLITVVLGAPTNATRFADVVRLVQRTETLSVTQAR